MTSRILVGKQLSESIEASKSLRQGCYIASTLFKVSLNRALRN